MTTHMTKIALSFAGGFIIGLLLIFAWNAYTDRSVQDVPGASSAPENMEAEESMNSMDSEGSTDSTEGILDESATSTMQSADINVQDQAAGEQVLVASAALEQDGWIVVHEEVEGRIGNALGAVRRDAGTYSSVTIPLLRGTQSGAQYWIVLYSDNGNRQFNLDTDLPLRDGANNPITSSFRAQ